MLGSLAATGVFAIVVIGVAIAFRHLSLGPASAPESGPAVGVHRPGAASANPRPDTRQPAYNGPGNPVGLPAGTSVTYGAGQKLTVPAFASHKNYTRGNLANGVRSAVATSAGFYGQLNSPSAVPSPGPPPHKIGSVGVGQIAACLSTVAARNGVLVVEIASYQGMPAMIIVSKPIGGLYRVTVEGLACSASRPDVLARITVPKAR